MRRFAVIVLILALTAAISFGVEYQFEDLGMPLDPQPADVNFVSQVDGSTHAWVIVEGSQKRGLVGIDVETGDSQWLDLAEYGKTHIQVTVADNGYFYIYAGRPGHFFNPVYS